MSETKNYLVRFAGDVIVAADNAEAARSLVSGTIPGSTVQHVADIDEIDPEYAAQTERLPQAGFYINNADDDPSHEGARDDRPDRSAVLKALDLSNLDDLPEETRRTVIGANQRTHGTTPTRLGKPLGLMARDILMEAKRPLRTWEIWIAMKRLHDVGWTRKNYNTRVNQLARDGYLKKVGWGLYKAGPRTHKETGRSAH